MRRICLPIVCHLCLLGQVPDSANRFLESGESAFRPYSPSGQLYEIPLQFNRAPVGLRAWVVSPGGRETVAAADLPATVSYNLTRVPSGTWELIIANRLGQVLSRQHVSSPCFSTIEVSLPEVATAPPPISLRRLSHRVPKEARKLVEKGEAAFGKGRKEEALALWRSALEIDPDNYEALSRAASLASAAGDHEAAADYYERALQIDGADTDLLVNSGNTLYHLGRYTASLERARTALRWSPDSARAHVLAGLSLLRLRPGSEEARRHLEQAKGRVEGVDALLRKLDARP